MRVNTVEAGSARSWPGALVWAASALAALSCVGLASDTATTQERKTPAPPYEEFDPKDFDRPTQIDNEWMPLKPGTRFVYEGITVEDDGTTVPHRVVINVTDLTKVIGGVRTVVSWDLDYSDGELAEAELAFFAQDNEGTVWRMGEYPEEYEEGKFVRCPAWIHGIEKAAAGIEMRARPLPGTPSYSQGWGPAIGFTDRGQVDQTGQKLKGPMGSYDDLLVIAEVSGAEKDAQQLKYFARGVGNVRVGWKGKGEKTKETLDLAKVEQLSPAALAEVHAGALKLEKSAYSRSKNVYAKTSPAESVPGAQGQ